MGMRRSIDAFCRNDKQAALVAAKARQAENAKFFRDHPPRAIEGLGGNTLHFDPVLWGLLRNGTNAAPGEDGEVQDWLARKHPEAFRVRHSGTKLQVGYWSTPQWRPSVHVVDRGAVRWTKTYAN